MASLTDEEKESLSPEEIAAMEGGEGGEMKTAEELADEEATAKAKADADAEAKEKAEEEAKAETEAETEAEKKAAAEEGDETKTDAGKEADAEAEAKEEVEAEAGSKPFTPKFTEVDLAELDKLKTALDEAKKKFDDGEIDYAKLDEVKDAFNEMKWKADFAVESNQNMQEGRWQWEQERFLDDNWQYRDNRTLNAAFVATVNSIITTDEGKKLSDKEVLAKAKKQVEADLEIIGEGSKKTEDEKQKAIDAAKKANADRSKIAADIGGLPAAEENEDVGEFAYLDKLEGEAYQAAVDKLTPEQLRKYEDS
jgi:fused signal recognition particle receptor